MSFGRAFSALTGASVVTMLAQVVRGKIAALLLGSAGVGVFNQLGLLFNLAQLAGQMGAFHGLVRHSADALAAEDHEEVRLLAATSTLLFGAISCLIAAAGVIFAEEISDLLLHDGGAHAGLVALVLLAVPIAVTGQTYRALLSGARAVRALVRTQVMSDLGSLLVFAILIFPLGLTGAVLGLMASHLILFVAGALYLRRELGRGLLKPRPSLFRAQVLWDNAGFSVTGLFMMGLSNLSVLLVSTMVIAAMGVSANGIFANGWRIASVYLGAVASTTISYFLPTLIQAPDDQTRSIETNKALRFYLLLLPPLMAGIMISGDLLVWLILSREFLPVAGLLLLFVPAELLRILGETMAAGLLVRKKLKVHALLYFCQAMTFITGAWLLLPLFGLTGAAAAYGLAMLLYLALIATVGLQTFGLRLERSTALAFGRAILLLAVSAAVTLMFPLGLMRIAGGAAILAAWMGFGWMDQAFVEAIRPIFAKLLPFKGRP